jgi:ribosome-associated heat shock protein Hsp15
MSTARIDRWLFGVRLFKSRSLAAEAVSGGKVHVNGARVRPAHTLRPGDVVTFNRGAVDFECEVVAIPERRGPAKEAVTCYTETEESRQRREQHAQRMRIAAAMAPRPEERPDKHQRRELRRLRGRD